MHFFHFLKLVILWMICHQIFSVAVCVELTEFLDINFKMPIFKPKFNFFKFLKPIRLSIPGGFWPCNFFPDILILRGQNYKIIGVKKLQAMTLQFEALGVLESKSWRKETPILNQKQNWGLFSLTFFIQALLRPQIAIQCHATILRVNFQDLASFKSKYLTTIYEAIILLGLLTVLFF